MNANDRGGAFDALANYHLTRVETIDAANAKNVPEFCLSESAEEALNACLRRRGVAPDFFASGFALGLHIARILVSDPFGCEAALRTLLDGTVRNLKDVVTDAVMAS
jgi:hypothetical protein